jgi:hypothetical protein
VVSDVISHAAATSLAHMQMLDVAHTSQSMRKVGSFSGSHGESGAGRGCGPESGGSGGGSGGTGISWRLIPAPRARGC